MSFCFYSEPDFVAGDKDSHRSLFVGLGESPEGERVALVVNEHPSGAIDLNRDEVSRVVGILKDCLDVMDEEDA